MISCDLYSRESREANGIDEDDLGGWTCGVGWLVEVKEISGVEVSNYQRIGDLISLISLCQDMATFLILCLIST